MFKKILNYVRSKSEEMSVLGNKALFLAGVRNRLDRELLENTKWGLGKYTSSKFKKDLYNNIVDITAKIISSPNAVMENRNYMADCICDMAALGVLILPSEPEPDPTCLRGTPGISGELKKYIKEIAGKDEFLQKFVTGSGVPTPTEMDIYDRCLLGYWTLWLRSEISNSCRIFLGDYNPDANQDWYIPFIKAMYIAAESKYREELGLEEAFEKGPMSKLEGMKYRTFLNFVLSDAKYPNLSWEENYKDWGAIS